MWDKYKIKINIKMLIHLNKNIQRKNKRKSIFEF